MTSVMEGVGKSLEAPGVYMRLHPLYAFSIRHRLFDTDKLMPLDGIVAQGGIECGVCFDGECRIDTTHVIHRSWSLMDCDRCPNHWNAS